MEAVHHPGGLVTWRFAGSDELGAVVVVTTRTGGCSTGPYASLNLAYHVGDDPAAVAENRERLCRAVGVDALTVAEQCHGDRVVVVDDALAGAGHGSEADARARLPATDALVTDRVGPCLAVLVADCAPVALVDPVRRAVAVVHAGRRGVVLDVPGATVRAMAERFGSSPGDLVAVVGPCIGADSYEIDGPALAETMAAFGPGLHRPTGAGRARFDLPGAVLARLLAAGVPGERVALSGVDTARRTDQLFSDRVARPCGRFMMLGWLPG